MGEDEASGGTRGHGVRYVPIVESLLAILAMSAAWIVPALGSG